MGLIAGWFDPTGAADADAVLGAVAAVRHGLPIGVRSGAATPAFGLVVTGDASEVFFAREGDVWAAVVGCPRWDDPTLARLARDRGHAAALTEAFRRHGNGLLDRVRGHFTVVAADLARREGLAAIDRAGVGRLCYAQPRPGALVFATSADAVCRYPGIEARVADQGIFDFLSCFAVPCPTTIYAGQRKLQPAQLVSFGGQRPDVRFYWRMPYDEAAKGDVPALAEELRATLRAATRRACGGEDAGRLGAFLSGGLDSSTVAGLLAAETDGRARTFTVGFAEPRFDERAFARVAAEHFATDHHEYVLTPDDAVALLPRLAEAYDEPFANTSAIPAYYCARQAREAGVATMLAGDGGDELFAGNSRYLDMMRMERWHGLASCLAPLATALPLTGLPVVRKVRDRVRRLALPLPDRMHFGALDATASLESVLSRDFLAAIDPRHPSRVTGEVYERTSSKDLIQRMLHHDLQLTLADNDLRKVVRMTELAGVRARFPLLDDDVMDFSARVPPTLLLAGGRLRDFYKRAMAGFLPEATLAKTKHGFGMPFDLWAQSHAGYRDFCLDGCRDFARRGILSGPLTASLAARRDSTASMPMDIVIDIALLESWLASRGF